MFSVFIVVFLVMIGRYIHWKKFKELKRYTIFIYAWIIVWSILSYTLHLDTVRKPICELQGGVFDSAEQTCHLIP